MATVSSVADKAVKALDKAGLHVDRVCSRRSDSQYLYVSIGGEERVYDAFDALEARGFDAFAQVSIRVSDHRNPARRFDRVSGSNDRAELTDFEVRPDLKQEWRPVVEAVIARLAPALEALREVEAS